MIRVLLAVIATGLMSLSAAAEQPPADLAFLQNAIILLQQQRNGALDTAVAAQARVMQQIEFLQK
jgi:hypothetical protein